MREFFLAILPNDRLCAKRRTLRLLGLSVCTLLVALQPARSHASELLRQGQWTVDAPIGGCGSLPLLQVKGPGTLFDAGNAAALSGLEEALKVPLAKVCPGVTEVILVNGRSRKLIRIKPQEAPSNPAATSSTTLPSSRAPRSADGAAASKEGQTIPQSGAPTTQSEGAPIVLSSTSPPVLPLRASLPGLSSARSQQAKCDVLFSWLELGKTSTVGRRPGAPLPAQAMDIFRDDTMTAVFGRPYDALDNGARIELAEKTFAPCDGEAHRTVARPPVNRGPVRIGGINIGNIRVGEPERPLPPEYRQEFAQYTELIHEAFAGRPGRFEPAAVTQFVQKIREEMQWANAATASADNAPATLDAFLRIQEDQGQIVKKGGMLRANERDLVSAYLAGRQSDLAPTVVQGWLKIVATAPSGIDSANALLGRRRQMDGVFKSLGEQQRAAAEATLVHTLDSDIAPTMQAETVKLASLRANWQGAQDLGSQEAEFLSRYAQFSSSASYISALAQFDAARSRIYPAVLPEWRKKVAASPLQSGDIAGLRDQLKTLFVSSSDRALPLFSQFEQPVRDRQAQLEAHVAEDEHRRLAEAERAAAVEARKEERASGVAQRTSTAHVEQVSAAGPLAAGSLKVGSGPDAEILNAVYEGAFEKINLDRSSTEFQAIGGGYIEGFSEKCSDFLPDSRVQIMRSECDEPYVWRNVSTGLVTSSGCYHYRQVPTGVFADPELYAALNSTPVQSASSALRSIFDMLTTKGNPFTAPINMAVNLMELKNDAHNMVTANPCTSPAIRRFQKNLQLFALGKEGLRLDGTVKLGVALLPPTAGTKYRDSDYARMLDDMVSEQGKNWAINRYIPGSISSVRVESRDSSGRPAKMSADYAFNGFSAREVGKVSLAFEEGRPSCLYFSDQPSSCRAPAHRVTTAYVEGEYR